MYDLVILQELICQLTGLKNIGDSTEAQQEALGGGPVLERELSMSDGMKAKKACKRFMASLLEQKLCMPIAVLLAQHRRHIVRGDMEQLKVTAWLFDHVHASLIMFGDFVESECGGKAYDGSVEEMVGEYGVEPEAAFYLLRPSLAKLVDVEEVGDDKMVIDTKAKDVWQEGLMPLIKSVHSILPESAWAKMSPHFYVLFWQLKLYDIHVPRSRYLAEIEKLRVVSVSRDLNARGSSAEEIGVRIKEKQNAVVMIGKLEEELKVQEAHVKGVAVRLDREKDWWFKGGGDFQSIIQFCLLPRCVFSPADAAYCARFLLMAHRLCAENFRTLYVIDKVFELESLHAVVYSCTELEAKNFGLYLSVLLSQLSAWERDEEVYGKECSGSHGFLRNKVRERGRDVVQVSENYYRFGEYERCFKKWQIIMRKVCGLRLMLGVLCMS